MTRHSNEKQLRLMLREIVSAAARSPNTDGSIQPREWAHQLVPTELIEKAETLLKELAS
jgi:hypothetical protein